MTDGAGLIIRPLTSADEPAWRVLWRDYLAFYETERPEPVYATTFARLTGGQAGEFRGLIAERDGQALGLAHYLFHRTTWEIHNACYLQDLYATPAARGTGVGRALIEAVYAAADAAGAPDVYWLTAETNATARRLYDRIGTKTPFIAYDRSR